MTEEKIRRINELYKKQKSIGLTDAEKEEQAILRREYVDAVKRSMVGNLDTIQVQEEDGSLHRLKKKEELQ